MMSAMPPGALEGMDMSMITSGPLEGVESVDWASVPPDGPWKQVLHPFRTAHGKWHESWGGSRRPQAQQLIQVYARWHG